MKTEWRVKANQIYVIISGTEVYEYNSDSRRFTSTLLNSRTVRRWETFVPYNFMVMDVKRDLLPIFNKVNHETQSTPND